MSVKKWNDKVYKNARINITNFVVLLPCRTHRTKHLLVKYVYPKFKPTASVASRAKTQFGIRCACAGAPLGTYLMKVLTHPSLSLTYIQSEIYKYTVWNI